MLINKIDIAEKWPDFSGDLRKNSHPLNLQIN